MIIEKVTYLPEIREQFILEYLSKNDGIRLEVIMEKFHVSEITARRDLKELEVKGFVIRTHRGAIKSEQVAKRFDFSHKLHSNAANKEKIGKLAASYIEEGDVVYMDCGTTVYYVSKYLKTIKNIRVITNSLPITSELIQNSNIKIHLIGGELNVSRNALYGPMTENTLNRYRANKAFIGASGVSVLNGLSADEDNIAIITHKMAEAADSVFLLCDSTKLEKDSFVHYAPISILNYLITDKDASPEIIELYEKNNINIITT